MTKPSGSSPRSSEFNPSKAIYAQGSLVQDQEEEQSADYAEATKGYRDVISPSAADQSI